MGGQHLAPLFPVERVRRKCWGPWTEGLVLAAGAEGGRRRSLGLSFHPGAPLGQRTCLVTQSHTGHPPRVHAHTRGHTAHMHPHGHTRIDTYIHACMDTPVPAHSIQEHGLCDQPVLVQILALLLLSCMTLGKLALDPSVLMGKMSTKRDLSSAEAVCQAFALLWMNGPCF